MSGNLISSLDNFPNSEIGPKLSSIEWLGNYQQNRFKRMNSHRRGERNGLRALSSEFLSKESLDTFEQMDNRRQSFVMNDRLTQTRSSDINRYEYNPEWFRNYT
jgi:hypothetical protein